jgi:hypothetical protein
MQFVAKFGVVNAVRIFSTASFACRIEDLKYMQLFFSIVLNSTDVKSAFAIFQRAASRVATPAVQNGLARIAREVDTITSEKVAKSSRIMARLMSDGFLDALILVLKNRRELKGWDKQKANQGRHVDNYFTPRYLENHIVGYGKCQSEVNRILEMFPLEVREEQQKCDEIKKALSTLAIAKVHSESKSRVEGKKNGQAAGRAKDKIKRARDSSRASTSRRKAKRPKPADSKSTN